MRIILAFGLLFANYFIVNAVKEEVSHKVKTSSTRASTQIKIKQTNTEIDQEAEEFKKAQEQIFKQDEEWRNQREAMIKKQRDLVIQSLVNIQKILHSNEPLLPDHYNSEQITAEAKAKEEQARHEAKIAEMQVAQSEEERKRAETAQEHATIALIKAREAVEEAQKALDDAQFEAIKAEQQVNERATQLEQIKELEIRDKETLQGKKDTVEEAIARLPKLQAEFKAIKEAQEMEAQYTLALDSQVGRWEALSEKVEKAKAQKEQLKHVKAKQVMLHEIELLILNYDSMINRRVLDRISLKPVVKTREEILYLANTYLKVTKSEVKAVVEKTKSDDRHKLREILKGIVKKDESFVTKDDLLTLIGYSIHLYEELAKLAKLNRTAEEEEKDIREAEEDAEQKVEAQLEGERERLGIKVFDVAEVKVTPNKGKGVVEDQESQSGAESGYDSIGLASETASSGNDSGRHGRTLGGMLGKDSQTLLRDDISRKHAISMSSPPHQPIAELANFYEGKHQ